VKGKILFLNSRICVNSNAFPKRINNTFDQIGNKTECALLETSYDLGYNFTEYRPSDEVNYNHF